LFAVISICQHFIDMQESGQTMEAVETIWEAAGSRSIGPKTARSQRVGVGTLSQKLGVFPELPGGKEGESM
jgi:hypothetical protein